MPGNNLSTRIDTAIERFLDDLVTRHDCPHPELIDDNRAAALTNPRVRRLAAELITHRHPTSRRYRRALAQFVDAAVTACATAGDYRRAEPGTLIASTASRASSDDQAT